MQIEQTTKDYTVACYYFPNYHVDARNEKIHGKGWTEWELVRAARPRFDGHFQPKEPMWGYCDEADPNVMAMKIDAASEHGIDAFIFDWYWYNDGPFLDKCLNNGFLGASNTAKLKFALMWANHDWYNIHPTSTDFIRNWAKDPAAGKEKLLYPGLVTEKTFDYITDMLVNEYFTRENYWLIDECPYFSIYELNMLINSFGGIANTKKQLDKFTNKAIKAGFGGLNLNAVIFAKTVLPGEVAIPVEKVLDELGFNSCTSYVWIHHIETKEFPTTDYIAAMRDYFSKWDEIEAKINIPYYPNITMGWDSSPRTDQSDVFDNIGYPYTPILSHNTPENFKTVLKLTKDKMIDKNADIVTVNCWNEWTEGSYLEPDTVYGMRYLEALKEVYGTRQRTAGLNVAQVLV